MRSVVLEIIKRNVRVVWDIKVTRMNIVANTNVYLIHIAPTIWPAKTRHVVIPAIVEKIRIALLEAIEPYVLAFPVTLVME